MVASPIRPFTIRHASQRRMADNRNWGLPFCRALILKGPCACPDLFLHLLTATSSSTGRPRRHERAGKDRLHLSLAKHLYILLLSGQKRRLLSLPSFTEAAPVRAAAWATHLQQSPRFIHSFIQNLCGCYLSFLFIASYFIFALSVSAPFLIRRVSIRVVDNFRPPQPYPQNPPTPPKSGSPALANQNPASNHIYPIRLSTLSGWIIGFVALNPVFRRLKVLTHCPRRMHPLDLVVPQRVLHCPLLPKHASNRPPSKMKFPLFAITAHVMKRRLVVFAAPRATAVFLNNTNSSRS